MPDSIQVGTILIRRDVILPEALQLESKPCAEGWIFANSPDGRGLAQQVREAGWTYFYMAAQVQATVFGFDPQKARSKALLRILAKMKPEECNSVEITKVISKRFLGLPYTTVTAHARHIQEGLFLFRPATRPEWTPQRRMAA